MSRSATFFAAAGAAMLLLAGVSCSDSSPAKRTEKGAVSTPLLDPAAADAARRDTGNILAAVAAPTTTTTTTSLAELATQYLAAVAPYNAATDLLHAKVAKLSPKATGAQYAILTEPLAHASEALSQALLRLPWPPTMKQDVDALVTADTIFESDLLGIRDQTLFSATAFFQQFINDSAKARAAVSIVRADLGLPPAK